eukprot:CAMPEP_0170599824 /NCGR_PEP_ID=MMETSP0224-20130122/17008_1 /TAXON_ID=285029 /ORGANISM="Togula jolla, Strain CCCM 725" /LENGTH=706 /DNA_ID=CAMNT_0010924511 /DNA_START=62 /DNA_END=2180 /DNA_ORIENTATION=+
MQLPWLALVQAAHLLALGTSEVTEISGWSAQKQDVSVSPLQKVIQMLNGMLDKGKNAKHEEQVQFAAYKQFCSNTEAEKTRAIAQAEEEIVKLTADVELLATKAEELGREVAQLDAQVLQDETEIATEKASRKAAHDEYTKLHDDYTETLDAITEAVKVIKARAKNVPQGAASLLMALSTPSASRQVAHRAVDAFLSSQDAEDPAQPQAYAYEFRSTDIVDMLQKLHEKFADERGALERQEMASRHAYDLLLQDLQSSISLAKSSKSAKVGQKADHLQLAATKRGDLEDTTSTRDDDRTYLSDLTTTCGRKASDFEERQKLRTDEIDALEKALDIISSNRVLSSIQLTSRPSRSPSALGALAQLRSSGRSPNQQRVAAYLHERGSQIHSRVLSTLALRVRDDPFAQVKKLLKDLIVRLMEESNEEAQHKTWCDQELAENKGTRDSRTTQIEGLTSQIDGMKSFIAKTGNEIVVLTQELADLTKENEEQTALRTKDKATNIATVNDAKEAQAAVQQAITILKEFYDRGEAVALVQTSSLQGQAPPIFEGAYEGMGSENGGVIAMLEVIESDYARLESSTTAMEETAEQDFNRFKTDNAVAIAQTNADIRHKTSQKQHHEQQLSNAESSLTLAERELAAAEKTYEKLKPSCIDSGSNFTEREQRRQEEIQSLQEALRILNGEDLPVSLQQRAEDDAAACASSPNDQSQ